MLLQCHLADHEHKNDTLTKTVKPKLSYAQVFPNKTWNELEKRKYIVHFGTLLYVIHLNSMYYKLLKIAIISYHA